MKTSINSRFCHRITPYNGKKESNAVYDQKGSNKSNLNQSMGVVRISNPAPMQDQRQGNQHKKDTPTRHFTKINMSLAKVLQHMLKMELITLRDPPRNPNTSVPSYHPDARCVYHSNNSGHDTNSCRALKNKIQDLIDEGVLEFTQDGQTEFCRPSSIYHVK